MVSPVPVSTASNATADAIAPWVAMRSRRRSIRSASTPEGSASSMTGSVVAVCTRGTSTAARGSPTSIHWAPTICIQVPRLETNCAIHNARKTGDRNGAQVVTGELTGSIYAPSVRSSGRCGLARNEPGCAFASGSLRVLMRLATVTIVRMTMITARLTYVSISGMLGLTST